MVRDSSMDVREQSAQRCSEEIKMCHSFANPALEAQAEEADPPNTQYTQRGAIVNCQRISFPTILYYQFRSGFGSSRGYNFGGRGRETRTPPATGLARLVCACCQRDFVSAVEPLIPSVSINPALAASPSSMFYLHSDCHGSVPFVIVGTSSRAVSN
jgi:hypothetical protein